MSDPLSRDPEDINYNLPEETEEVEDLADAIAHDPLLLDVEPPNASAQDDE